MKVSHETPLIMMEESRTFNDYDYALVHHFKDYPEYFEFFVKSLEMGREVILDNSLYELGSAFDPVAYKEWILKLNPTYYIVPDTFWDADATIEQAENWFNNVWSKELLNIKSIGVAQGATYDDIVRCYKYMADHTDRIAFTFKFHPNMLPSLVGEVVADSIRYTFNPSVVDGMTRLILLTFLYKNGVIDPNIKHHLLGAQNTKGLKQIAVDYPWITSIDTSNPIMYGWEGNLYNQFGNISAPKPSTTVDSVFDNKEIPNIDIIRENVKIFKSLAS